MGNYRGKLIEDLLSIFHFPITIHFAFLLVVTLFAVPSLVSESWFYYCLYHLTILFYHLAHNYCVSTRKYSAIASTVHAWPLVDICYLEQKKQNIFSILSIMRNAAAASLVPSNCLARFKKSFLPQHPTPSNNPCKVQTVPIPRFMRAPVRSKICLKIFARMKQINILKRKHLLHFSLVTPTTVLRTSCVNEIH